MSHHQPTLYCWTETLADIQEAFCHFTDWQQVSQTCGRSVFGLNSKIILEFIFHYRTWCRGTVSIFTQYKDMPSLNLFWNKKGEQRMRFILWLWLDTSLFCVHSRAKCYLPTHLCQEQPASCCPTLLLPWWTPFGLQPVHRCVCLLMRGTYCCAFNKCVHADRCARLKDTVHIHVLLYTCWLYMQKCVPACVFIGFTCLLQSSIQTVAGIGVWWFRDSGRTSFLSSFIQAVVRIPISLP